MSAAASLLLQPDAMVAPAPGAWPPAEGLALDTGYELDPFQKHAVLGIHAGNHVFVTAKTGSGKTFVGEYLIARALAAGKRVFYTTPIKSLSNQKYHDLKKLFPAARVGILTGDIKMCPDADVVVMTAEILRNLFYKRGTATEGVGLSAAVSLDGVVGVVMDEVHYIQDPDRGHVWEESMILCPRDLQLVLLSATMPSAASLAGWLAALHGRPTMLLSTLYRVVPLEHGILRPSPAGGYQVAVALDARGGWHPEAYRGWLTEQKAAADAAAAHRRAVADRRAGGYSTAPPVGKAHVEAPMARLRRTVNWLQERGQLPALFFVFSRRECERYAHDMTGSFLDSSDTAAAAHIFDFHLSRHSATLEKSPQYHAVRDLALRGIAFHHSGLQPLLKEIVELLFTRGFVRLLFATETFAVGLNMPTKTVVFLDLSKFTDGGTHRLLRPDEYIQMAGRAGRRGKDTRGLVLYEPMRDPIEVEELRGLLCGTLPPLESRMRFHYDFLMRRLLGGAGVPAVAEQSYWAAQQREARVALGVEAEAATAAASVATAAISTADDALLTEHAELERAVATTKNAAQRRARTALDRWVTDHAGAAWDRVKAAGARRLSAVALRDRLAASVATWDTTPLVETAGLEACLARWGLISAEGSLTPVGVAATEVNEGHNILMPLLAESGLLTGVSAEETACVLAGFLRESAAGDSPPSLDSAGLSAGALGALDWLDRRAGACQEDEDRAGVMSSPDFWGLSSLWVNVASRWLAGAGLTEIATEFGLFEGNVQRGLMRVANLIEEWGAICELRRDLAGLERIRSLRFLRDEVIVDSLYLRL
jgi:superfamily II RNA helicase